MIDRKKSGAVPLLSITMHSLFLQNEPLAVVGLLSFDLAIRKTKDRTKATSMRFLFTITFDRSMETNHSQSMDYFGST